MSDTALGLCGIGGSALLVQVVCLIADLVVSGGGPAESVVLVELISVRLSVLRLAQPKPESNGLRFVPYGAPAD